MTRTLINLTFAATLLIGAVSSVRSEDTAPPKAVEPQPKFAVFTSFGCSRSFGMDSAHISLSAAIRQAQALREKKQLAWVVTGTPGTDPSRWASFALIPGRRHLLKVENCVVYKPQCRGSWQAAGNSPDIEKAEALAEEVRKAGSNAEVVYSLAGN